MYWVFCYEKEKGDVRMKKGNILSSVIEKLDKGYVGAL